MKSDITATPAEADMLPATSVSIRATRETLDALLVIAAQRRVKVADLIAEAVENTFGDEIRAQLLFFASTDYKSSQSTKKEVSEGEAL
jgi:hypothetical protein